MTAGCVWRAWRVLAACAGALAVTAAAAGCTPVTNPLAPAAPDGCTQLAAARATAPPPVDPLRPTMGYDPFNTFGTTFSQKLILSIAAGMARNGMRAAGYRYIILDDGWQGPRNAAGQITADSRRFPCGIKWLAGFLRREGFRLGLYTTPGTRSCADRTGSGGHAAADVRTFAGWGVDYIKLDWCNADYGTAAAAAIARQWRAAIAATGRPMILSINAGGSPTVAPWASTVANSWRIGGDICGSWYNQSRPPPPTARRCYHDRRYHMGVADYLKSPVLRQESRYAGPGHYLDPDMLEVGTAPESGVGQNLPGYALTFSEAETNFSMWAMWSAPLIAGNDPRTMSGQDPASRILLNRGIIAIDADPLAHPARLIPAGLTGHRDTWQVWRKPLSGGRVALSIVNLGNRPGRSVFSWAQLRSRHRPAQVTDLWAGRGLPVRRGLAVHLPAHGTGVYLLSWGR